MKIEQTECSETSAYKIQTPGELPIRKHKSMCVCVEVFQSRHHIAAD